MGRNQAVSTFAALYETRCRLCHEPILPGQQIAGDYGRWLHVPCAQRVQDLLDRVEGAT
jgi:cytochrome c5